MLLMLLFSFFFFFKQKTAYEMRISDWSSDVCSSDLCFVGNTWDPSKQGLKRLTLTGRCALLIAICGLTLSLYQTYQQRLRAGSIEAVAYRELRDGWTQLAIPFHQALWTLEGDRPPLGVSVLTELQQGNRLAQAKEIEYGSAPPLDLYQSRGMASSDERRVGKACVSRCRCRCSPYH